MRRSSRPTSKGRSRSCAAPTGSGRCGRSSSPAGSSAASWAAGEDRLLGRGVSYCATCDGAFFTGKTAAVVGGGNTAVEDALYLATLCEKVYLIHRRQGFRATEAELAKLRGNPKVEFVLDATVAEVRGEDKVESLLIRSTTGGPDRELAVSAVFVAVGLIPGNGQFADQLPLTQDGYLIADENCRTRPWPQGLWRRGCPAENAAPGWSTADSGTGSLAAEQQQVADLMGDAVL